MINLFSRMAENAGDAAPEATPEELAAERKKQNREFHWAKVRNGPVSWTAGRSERRQKAIDQRGQQRKGRNRRVRRYQDEQHAIAMLRGQLQAVGAVPYADPDFRPSAALVTNAVQSIVRRASLTPTEVEEMHGPVLQERIGAQIAADRALYEQLVAA